MGGLGSPPYKYCSDFDSFVLVLSGAVLVLLLESGLMSETICDHEKPDVYRKIQSSTSTAMLSTSRSCESARTRP